MKRPDELLSSIDKSWTEFSRAWRRVRGKGSERSVHDLRVNARRLIAAVELARVLGRREYIVKLQPRFKKVLKDMGALRDLQVQLETLTQIEHAGVLAGFKRRLERRERQAIEKIQDDLKRKRKGRLAEAFRNMRSEFDRLQESLGVDRFQRSVERFLSVRQNEFLKARQRFRRSQPSDNEETLHQMRIALKKLRYTVEAAQPVLDPSAKERIGQMRVFQQLMGKSRDMEILRSELEKWAKKKGKMIAVVPALDHLQSKRNALLKKIIESSNKVERFFEPETPKPLAETTQAINSPPPRQLYRDGYPVPQLRK